VMACWSHQTLSRVLNRRGATSTYQSLSPDEGMSGRRKSGMRIRINFLCFIGAILGVVAIFLSWYSRSWWEFDDAHHLTQNLLDFLPYYPLLIGLYVAACIASFISPLAGFPMTASALFIQQAIADDWIPRSWPYGSSFSLDIGSYIACFASIIVILSLLIPIGMHIRIGFSEFKRRLLALVIEKRR